MAIKKHCDICDVTPATMADTRKVARPGDRPWNQRFSHVTVVVQQHPHDDGSEVGRLDVCEQCREKLVADAYHMKTYDEYNALRDQLDLCRAELIEAKDQISGPEPDVAVADDRVNPGEDIDCPF